MKTLSELDMETIMINAPLRHRLNFEIGAQFWPDYTTKVGRRRKSAAKTYWMALEMELAIYMKPDDEELASRLQGPLRTGQLNRLPVLLQVVKDILQTILREEHAIAVEQTLDVALLMQQIQKHACDITKLADWLATILKSSCSPQRDEQVMQMTDLMKEAALTNNPHSMVDSIEDFFSILETMKLVSSVNCTTERYG